MLLPILGTSWIFGVLAVNHQVVAFQYIFAILNSLQVGAQGPADGPAGSPRCERACRALAVPEPGQEGGPSLCAMHTPASP